VTIGLIMYLDEILALGLGDKRLELRRREGIYQSSLRNNKQKDLGASQNGQFIGLLQLQLVDAHCDITCDRRDDALMR
jgi:hypothetical protein